MQRRFIVSAVSYFVFFALVGTFVGAFDYVSTRPVFTVVGEPPPDYWARVSGNFPSACIDSIVTAIIAVPFYLVVSWWQLRQSRSPIKRVAMVAGCVGVVSAMILCNYWIEAGRAVRGRPWFQQIILENGLVVITLSILATVTCAWVGTMFLKPKA